MSDKPLRHAIGKSDDCVLARRDPNQGGTPSAEGLEGRRSIAENTPEAHPRRTQSRVNVSQGLWGVREAAKKDKGMEFTALLHHVTETLLWDSFYLRKKEAAPGVDEVTWQEYAERAYREQGLEARIRDLPGRVQRGAYRAQPSRRVYIPKLDGRQRPLGIAAVEDQVVQQAVGTVLKQI